MKSLITLILSIFCILSFSQEKVFTREYRNMYSSNYCLYTKPDMKPFNGYVKFQGETPGEFQYNKIENDCNRTLLEVFSSKNELLFRGKYTFDKSNNQITTYENDSVNLGRSEFFEKKITDSATLVTKRIMNYYHSDVENGIEKVTPLDGIIYTRDEDQNGNEGEIYSIQYKNGTAVKLITYYDNRDFVKSSSNIPKLKRKESHELLFNENGNIYDSDLSNKTYPFIFTGEYLRWDQNGKVIAKKNLNK